MRRSAAVICVLSVVAVVVAVVPAASGSAGWATAVGPDGRLTLERAGASPITGQGIVITTGIESLPSPGQAFSFVLTVTLPANLAFVRSTPGQPAAIPCEAAGQTVTCRGRHIGGDITANVALTVQASVPGAYLVRGSLALEDAADANPADNDASLEFTVAAALVVKPCVVPRLRGRTLGQARRLIAAANCRLGAISHHRDARLGRGLVVASRPLAGARIASRSRIALVLSRGPR